MYHKYREKQMKFKTTDTELTISSVNLNSAPAIY